MRGTRRWVRKGGRGYWLDRSRLRDVREIVCERVDFLLVGEEDVVVVVPKGKGRRG